jgi:hypothetical protein
MILSSTGPQFRANPHRGSSRDRSSCNIDATHRATPLRFNFRTPPPFLSLANSSSSRSLTPCVAREVVDHGQQELVSIVQFHALQPAKFSDDRLSFSEQVT